MSDPTQSHLYMLVHASEPMFKIGIANDIKGRTKQIGQKVNLSASLFSAGTRSSVSTTERVLHKLLKKAKVDRVVGSGGTEWFSIDYFQTARETLESIRELVEVSELKPIAFEPIDVFAPAKAAVKPKHYGIGFEAWEAHHRQLAIDRKDRKQERRQESKQTF